MSDKPDIKKPVWVKLAVLGLSSRMATWACFWLSILVIVNVVIFCLWIQWLQGALLSCLFTVSPIWYYLAIKWMDKNDQW